jgi:hypothetical protein
MSRSDDQPTPQPSRSAAATTTRCWPNSPPRRQRTRAITGELRPLADLLGERLHRHGAAFGPVEAIERLTGGPLDSWLLLAHLRAAQASGFGRAPADHNRARAARRP